MSSNTNTSESEFEWNYSDSDIAHKFLFFNVLKDGRVHVLKDVSPSFGFSYGNLIKDVVISLDVSVRIFLASSASSTNTCTTQKLPLLIYMHGRAFCRQSAFSENYTCFSCNIAAEANVIVVSVDYGLFSARPIPACYDDSWAALQWVASHSKSPGPEPWVNDYAELGRIFVGGDSAGGNISHTVFACCTWSLFIFDVFYSFIQLQACIWAYYIGLVVLSYLTYHLFILLS